MSSERNKNLPRLAGLSCATSSGSRSAEGSRAPIHTTAVPVCSSSPSCPHPVTNPTRLTITRERARLLSQVVTKFSKETSRHTCKTAPDSNKSSKPPKHPHISLTVLSSHRLQITSELQKPCSTNHTVIFVDLRETGNPTLS